MVLERDHPKGNPHPKPKGNGKEKARERNPKKGKGKGKTLKDVKNPNQRNRKGTPTA